MEMRSLLSGMAIGAALALAFDSEEGNRRRALIRDTMRRGTRLTGNAIDAAMRDVRNRARGLAAVTCDRFLQEEVDDPRLIERVRARVGRACSHPHAVGVYVHDGEVTLTGPVLADEVSSLLIAAASVRGVHAVVNELEPHDSPEGVPSLQGKGRLAGAGLDLFTSAWAPATLVGAAALAAGGIAIAYARR